VDFRPYDQWALQEQPTVELGTLLEGGLAPAIFAIVERGVTGRPHLAADLRAEVELNLGDTYPNVRVLFGDPVVLVEDGPAAAPDLRISGELPDLVSLMVAPLIGGVPNPIDRRGRAALQMVAQGRVRVEGKLALLRRFLGVIGV
jgi:hypothetical protein